jgi:hypothetical protein
VSSRDIYERTLDLRASNNEDVEVIVFESVEARRTPIMNVEPVVGTARDDRIAQGAAR